MSGAAAVELRGVGKRFGALEALNSIDLVVEPGEFVSLLGPSGSGKTTLLRIIAGLDDATAGTVSISGTTPDVARSEKRFGWVPQSPGLLPWRNVEQNAALLTEVNRRGARPGRARIRELLQQVGLAGFEQALPHQLSGGMQQRVALVRAFALGAPILLMDEPFAALDEITRTEMRHALLDLWATSGAAVVFVTHSIAEAVYLSDRIAVLSARPGRITSIQDVSLPRPRSATIEDSPDFFANVTSLRAALRRSMDAALP